MDATFEIQTPSLKYQLNGSLWEQERLVNTLDNISVQTELPVYIYKEESDEILQVFIPKVQSSLLPVASFCLQLPADS